MKTRLSHYGKMCRKEPIVVTVNGVPTFELVPLNEDDDLVDQLIEHNPDFRAMLRKRVQERTMTVAEALKKL